MKRLPASRTFRAVLFAVPLMLLAKGDTLRIVITGRDLSAPIEISDQRAAARFNVWTGTLSVDPQRGPVLPPANLRMYEVSFVTTRSNPGIYVVRYGIDPLTNEGFVYVPGKEDSHYRDNTWLITRGIEGQWFHSRDEWEVLARPLIENARVSQVAPN
ncbi:MAG: hypothetical protein JWN34_4236 [Bryobacterales bacterium]|nr:hypothetical protein [Bryobacterales bacterium]